MGTSKRINTLKNVLKNHKQNGHPIEFFTEKADKYFKEAFNELKEGNARKDFVYTLFNIYKEFLEYVIKNFSLDRNCSMQTFSKYKKVALNSEELLNSLSENSHLFNHHTKEQEQTTLKNNTIESLKSFSKKSKLYLTTENDIKLLLNHFQKDNSHSK